MKRDNFKEGKWACRNTPRWALNYFEIATRMKLSVRYIKSLIRKYDIQPGYITRPVRMANGDIKKRKLAIITFTQFEHLLLRHGGFRHDPTRPNDAPPKWIKAQTVMPMPPKSY